MRYVLLAAGLLLVIAAACANGPAAAKRAELDGILAPAQARPAEPQNPDVQVASPPAADEVAPQGQPQAAEMTAAERQVEIRDLLDARQREKAAQATLAENAAVRVDYGGIVITLSDSVLFAPEQSALLASSQPMMKKVAGALLVTKDRDMVIEGHTDSNGTTSGNIELSRQRAEAVRAYLIAQGYPAARIRAQGIGQDRPVADNSSAKGRERNRRMEILVSVKRDEAL